MLLAFSTWPEIEARLRQSRTIVVPIGSTEQHGPTGMFGTDWLCPEIISHSAHGQGDLLVAPTFIAGMAQHHLGFAGTISLRPSTMIASIVDWANSLATGGFDHIYWLNGHGGNVPTIEAAISEFYAASSFAGLPARAAMVCVNWWALPGVAALCEDMFPEGHGTHATPSEIAVVQAGYPKSVRQAVLEPSIAPLGPIRDAAHYRCSFPDGRMGSDPTQASAEQGRAIIELAVEGLIEDVGRFELTGSVETGASTLKRCHAVQDNI